MLLFEPVTEETVGRASGFGTLPPHRHAEEGVLHDSPSPVDPSIARTRQFERTPNRAQHAPRQSCARSISIGGSKHNRGPEEPSFSGVLGGPAAPGRLTCHN